MLVWEVRLNTEAIPEIVKMLNTMGVFLSSGANPLMPRIMGGIIKLRTKGGSIKMQNVSNRNKRGR